jgi:hypothetical protein
MITPPQPDGETAQTTSNCYKFRPVQQQLKQHLTRACTLIIIRVLEHSRVRSLAAAKSSG